MRHITGERMRTKGTHSPPEGNSLADSTSQPIEDFAFRRILRESKPAAAEETAIFVETHVAIEGISLAVHAVRNFPENMAVANGAFLNLAYGSDRPLAIVVPRIAKPFATVLDRSTLLMTDICDSAPDRSNRHRLLPQSKPGGYVAHPVILYFAGLLTHVSFLYV